MKKLFLLLQFLPLLLQAQITFGPENVITPYTNGPRETLAADLDGDGDIDIISASSKDDKIAWFENDGNANFINPTIVSTDVDEVRDIEIIDLDGDGDKDIIAASFSDDKIAWFENDGDGNFSNAVIISTNVDVVWSVFSTDLDGDEDNDVIATSLGDGKIVWFENGGDGTFSDEIIISDNLDAVRTIFSIDLDNDGDNDIIASFGYNTNKISWYENNGDGTFSDEIIINDEVEDADSLFSIDLDNDGDNDIMTSLTIYNPFGIFEYKTLWFENDGSGNFGPKQTISSSKGGKLYSIDLDNDGDNDVIAARYGVYWFENDGSGNFTQQTVSASSDDSAFSTDLDGDGDKDVISCNYSNDKVIWHENDGNESFTSSIISDSPYGLSSISQTDLDGDGDKDVVASARYDNKIVWYENDGSSNFSTQKTITDDINSPLPIASSDLDNDGDIDIITATNYGDKIVWYENTGSGIFSDEIIISEDLDDIRSLLCFDFENDGDIDIVAASTFDEKIISFTNDGSGNFSDEIYIDNYIEGPKTIFSSDLNSDGFKDIIATTYFGDEVFWYQNIGNGYFGYETIIIDNVNWIDDLFCEDLDGDGDNDMVIASPVIKWYKNDGSGNFGNQPIISSNDPDAIFIKDLDNDGDNDIVTADDNLSWYENDGIGNFSTEVVIDSILYDSEAIICVDLDGDADSDILYASFDDNKISWYENLLVLNEDCPSAANAFPGSMDSIQQYFCFGEEVNATTTNAILAVGTELWYILKDENDEILSSNQSGSFELTEENILYHISAVIGSTNDGNLPDLADECTTISNTTPVMLLSPIVWDITASCDSILNNQIHITFSINGGLASIDEDTNYMITSDYLNTTIAPSDTISFTIEDANEDEILELWATDESDCEAFNTIIELPVCESCESDAGSMNSGLQYFCFGEEVSAITSNAMLADGAELWYVLMDENDNILDSNQSGNFELEEENVPYSISAVVGLSNEGNLPNLDDECSSMSDSSASVMQLAPINFELNEECNDATGEYTLSVQFIGGLPSQDSSETYTISGDYSNNELYASETFQITINDLIEETELQLSATDALGCQASETILVDCTITSITPLINSTSAIQISYHGDQIIISESIQSVVLINMMGQLVASSENNRLNVSHLPSGIYLVSALLNGKKVVKKFIL